MQQSNIKKIGTHSGAFHADEVLACVMLTRYTSTYQNAQITRSRDAAVLEQQDIVVDVGGVYVPERHRYDHHQREFTDTFSPEYQIKLSSAGLIYKHFGREVLTNVVAKILSESELTINLTATPQELADLLYQRIYDGFFLCVDAQDNGIDQYAKEARSKYEQKTTFSHRIARLNPAWSVKGQDENEQFRKAMDIAEDELLWQVRYPLLNWYPARPIVQEAILKRFSVHLSGTIICLHQAVPWKDHLEQIERENNISGQLRFVLFAEGGGKAWRVQAINLQNSFDTRLGLKKEWRGIKDEAELKRLSGIQDIVFVHINGFIGGAISYESALRMAELSLQDEQHK